MPPLAALTSKTEVGAHVDCLHEQSRSWCPHWLAFTISKVNLSDLTTNQTEVRQCYTSDRLLKCFDISICRSDSHVVHNIKFKIKLERVHGIKVYLEDVPVQNSHIDKSFTSLSSKSSRGLYDRSCVPQKLTRENMLSCIHALCGCPPLTSHLNCHHERSSKKIK